MKNILLGFLMATCMFLMIGANMEGMDSETFGAFLNAQANANLEADRLEYENSREIR